MRFASGPSALLWTTFLGLGLLVLADDKPCTLHHKGNYYDLSSLKASKDYEFETPGGHPFYLNVCRRVATDPWSPSVPDDADIAGLVRKDHHDFAIGMVNTTLEMRDTGLMLHLSNGSPCPEAEDSRGSSAIMFRCDTTVYGSGKPMVISQWPDDEEKACQYTIEWRTHYACPTGERGLISGIVVSSVITLMILFMLFIVASTLYNRFVLRKRGFDQLAQLSKAHLLELMEFCGDIFRTLLDNIRLVNHTWATSGPRNLNATSHHWSSRDEERAMMAADPLEDDTVHDQELQDTNAWRNDTASR